MALDDIPQFTGGKPITKSGGSGGSLNRRWLYIFGGIFLAVDVLLAAWFLFPAFVNDSPGGLDGCLTTASGEPASAVVRINGVERPTFEDGCFFFAELPSGSHQFEVETNSGVVLSRQVEIIPGEATALGTVSLP